MWITAWLLVGKISLQQVMFPPFYSQEDCEAVRKQHTSPHYDRQAVCVQAKVFVNVTK